MTTEIDWAHPAMPRVRYRINVNRLAKGQLSFDCTVEWEGPFPMGGGREAALEESDRLVAALQARYPMGVE